MPATSYHFSLCVNGALSWSPREFARKFKGSVTRNDGTPMPPEELRAELEKLRDQGVKVLPIGPACEGFDSVTGCPGHPVEGGDT